MSNKTYANLRVLVVDADTFTRNLVKGVLEDLGFERYNLFDTGEGMAALELLRYKKVDLVICARNMGAIDGVDFVRRLRDPKHSPAIGVPVIFCSRQLNRQLVGEIREAGVDEAIIKPITLSAIESRIRAIREKPRPQIAAPDYFGPDRRRVVNPKVPRERRAQPREGR
jgi:two-component system chemotaxis response regulator CheY